MTNDLGKLASMHADLSHGNLLHINDLGEPFFDEGGSVFKFSPEDGDKEFVCKATEFAPSTLDDYFSAHSLISAWNLANGPIPDGCCLVPVTPFVLGGEFSPSNLRAVSLDGAAAFYHDLRHQIASLKDGDAIRLKIVK